MDASFNHLVHGYRTPTNGAGNSLRRPQHCIRWLNQMDMSTHSSSVHVTISTSSQHQSSNIY
eukprot:14359395-Ditylum_brightwellii.AAC.1